MSYLGYANPRIVMDYGHKCSGLASLTPPPASEFIGRLGIPGAQRMLPSSAQAHVEPGWMKIGTLPLPSPVDGGGQMLPLRLL